MFARVVSILRAPAFVALVVLMLAATATIGASSKPIADKDEVSIITITGGPVDTTTQGAEVTIPLNGQDRFVFTQRAGDVVQIVTAVTADPNTAPGTSGFCDMTAIVYDDGTNIGTRADFSTNKGEYGEGGAGITALAASATDRTVTLTAFAREDFDFCDEDLYDNDGLLFDSGPDTWTVSVKVSIITVRN